MTTTKQLSTNIQARLQKVGSVTDDARWQRLVGFSIFISQRLIFGILVLVSIIFLSYLILDIGRGVSFPSSIAIAVEKSVAYLNGLIHGDLGLTAAGSVTLRPMPISEVVPIAFARSLVLILASLLIAAPIGIVLGIWASRGRHTSRSMVVLLVSIVGVSIPSFFAALLLQLAVIRLTQVMGRTVLPVGGFGWDEHLILPALVLAARPLAQITRVSFISLSNVLEQDYVRTAYSKGLVARMVMNNHVIRNAAVPVLTTLGVSLRFSLSSLPVVELFFGWAGLGFTLLKSISRQDDELTVTLFLCLGVLFILANILLEVSYRVIDPRLREAPEHVKREQGGNIISKLSAVLARIHSIITLAPIKNWLRRRKAPAAPNPFRAVLDERGESTDVFNDGREGERRAWLQGTLGNIYLILGVLLIGILIAVIAFNPRLAPHSPYTTRGLTIEDGEFIVPPFEPDEIYPWGTDVLGRDMMSLVLAGAQQTLLLATVVMLARMVIGFVLGALAGWMNGGWLDRLLLGASEVIAAFPTLLLAMMLILALGIRQGLQPFVVALCFVGWSEVMLFVRGEVMKIRPMLYIESAVALGLRMPRMILWHILPNLIPALVSLAALEMGAVLMLLGELGFIGIFIGGGAFAELDVVGAPFHYSDVPEWGALLSNVRTYARSYAWMAIYPSLAFFVAIMGFNLLGEGIRRMIDIVGVPIMRMFNRYTLAFGLVATLGFMWVRGNTGSLAFYEMQASEFIGENALVSVAALSHPSLGGRALGSDGMDVAAEYIASQFESMGLQAAGENLTYFQPRKRDYESLDTVPRLAIGDGEPPLVYRQDYVERPSDYRNLGLTLAKVKFVALGDLVSSGTSYRQYQALQDRDYSDEIILVLSDRDADFLSVTPRAGMLVVAEDPYDLQRRYTLSSVDPRWRVYGTGRQRGQDAPMFWISEATADRLLKGSGNSISELRRIAEKLGQDEVFEIPTDVTVGMELKGTVHEQVTVNHVVGHLPGSAGRIAGVSSEAQLDDQVILVMAQYDSPPMNPDENFFPGANDNASGVAVMLETIRTIQESGYQPYKTFIFVAYSGEGLEGGSWYFPEPEKFLQTKFGFSKNLKVESVIELRGLGYQEGEELVLLTGGSLRLANLFESAARRMGVPVRRAGEAMDISIVFEDRSIRAGGDEAPGIGLVWDGWESVTHSSNDTVGSVSSDNLESAGRALSLALMILGREINY